MALGRELAAWRAGKGGGGGEGGEGSCLDCGFGGRWLGLGIGWGSRVGGDVGRALW